MRFFDHIDALLAWTRQSFKTTPRVVEMYFNVFEPERINPAMTVEEGQRLLLMRRKAHGFTSNPQPISTGFSTTNLQQLIGKQRVWKK